jgi:hypothetical protein
MALQDQWAQAAPRTAERVAKNDAAFRDANEGIEESAQRLGLEEGLVPFLCECADERCTEILSLNLAEYEEVRRHPARFVNVPGHDRSAGPWARVVEDHGRFHVVEKTGRAKEIVEDLDPRSDGGA